MSHTPGPWKPFSGDANCVIVRSADQRCIATAWNLRGPNGEEPNTPMEANAQLIAAAPRMLKALQEIVRNVEPWKTCDNAAGRLFEIATGAIEEATTIDHG